ncbi:hypothetical protein BDV37DRAFT_285356 [Aspergillus pseudonomiae]|uniref:YCII-related domain-containing protein n=1 Tax=Aspergillus pseudonomiae TaxID=1506151 RepID=A0A5N7D5Y4_9EURO|nr:uncharacterized protein BDV37DRAFT_285356 [Aspergillus pseudonomiae]KAE8401806.1 hypothetical protein BDV37DRAFT_285356 [Aspergillus pseudonomiae]
MTTRLAPRLASRAHFRPSPPSPISTRFLSTKTKTKPIAPMKEFLCIILDKPNVLGLRKKVKCAHYEGVKLLVAAGRLVNGGAILESHSTENSDIQIRGSMVVYTGESAEEVRAVIEKDVYVTSGVWDLEKMQIWPYDPAVREPVC